MPRFILLLFLLTVNCELFYPSSPVEQPEEGTYDNPLNFPSILDGMNISFSKSRYEEMFHESFMYEEKDGQVFKRDEMIVRFNEISKSIGSVVWLNDPGSSDDKNITEEDTVTLYRLYSVVSADSDTLDEGNSRFEIVYYESKNTWSILEWHNDHNSQGVTYFNPEYSQ